MNVCVLRSGSKGNLTLVASEEEKILIDCGLPCYEAEQRLKELNCTPQQIDAILITHEHSDHCCGLQQWVRRYGTPVYVHQSGVTGLMAKSAVELTAVHPFDASFSVGNVRVEFLPVSHDAAFCVAYKLTQHNVSFASVTDLGTYDDALFSFLYDCRTVLLESNHDLSMLNNGLYPYPLKKRIASDVGHLSNDQANAVLKELVRMGTTDHVILGHLSQHNNTPELVFDAAVRTLKECGWTEGIEMDVDLGLQYRRSKIFYV